MRNEFSTVDAAALVGIDVGRLRGWLQHRHIEFGAKSLTGRYSFSVRDVRVIALMAALSDHGIEPSRAAKQAASIVDRVGSWSRVPMVALFSRDEKVSPCLCPEDTALPEGALIAIPIATIFGELDARAAA